MISRTLLGGIFALVLTLSLFAIASGGEPAAGPVVLRTVPAQTNVIADGSTIYRMDVFADSTTAPGTQVDGFQWSIMVPSYVTITSAALPTQSDFFSGSSMFMETFDASVENGRLRDNYRLTWGNGPSDKVGYLGSYWFKVNTNAPLGSHSFDIENTPGRTEYVTHDEEAYLPTIENTPFTINAPAPTTPPVQPTFKKRFQRVDCSLVWAPECEGPTLVAYLQPITPPESCSTNPALC